ncbi:Transcriptional regulator, contains XRE-family HTH domain [Chitinophaga costaii]|uniref:Transcriptional regulator, contains XRE-family HTH domain n=1 Tax=Chitinophaga costaii TaxID=1335309 RepID=A0A1C4C1C4_9BACT|nr:LexA family transcriptional regulator [Chitinophaga costaii]PUZ27378.1 helix-turn-helix domain-containing protein [Chitinophaga costaii]SCC12878.1 Transcriptional regulator, contains XRE-family HTH domain [Chitinophaga costaii]
MSIVCRNLKYLRKQKGWTQQEFADKLGIKRSLLGAYEEERAEPRTEVLEMVSDMYRVSIDDLLRRDLGDQKENFLEKRRQLKMANNRQQIEFVPVKAAAGYLAGYNDDEFIEELNTFTLPMLGAGSYRAFEIAGDSMLPTPSGSVIVCHKVDGWDELRNNETYVVMTSREGIVYKRVIKSNRSKTKVTLMSDNPQFEPYSVSMDDILEIWQTDAVISKTNNQSRMSVNHLADMVSHLQDQVTLLKKKIKE